MKMIKFLSLGLCFLLAGMSLIRARAQASKEENEYQAIDDYITARMRSDRIPGMALAIVKGDQIVYMKGYGQADPSGRPATPQTPFLIGSITKPFTALAIMQLVDAGKVDIDAPVQRYIPWFRVADPQASAQITVRMLINQTSGLPGDPTQVTWTTWTWQNTPDAIERYVRLLAKVKLAFPPGQSFTYANDNYATLGMIIQSVTGQSYEDYIREQVFAPLDMQNSFVSEDEAAQHGLATGYRWWFGFPVPASLPFNRANLPAGFVISSAEDMAHFLIAQMNGGRYQDVSVLSPKSTALMQSEPPPGRYGMGWETAQLNGRRLINQDGSPGSFQTSLFFDPETRVGVFVAANIMNALDTISAAHGTSNLDGITTRSMAETVLAMATSQPIPDQGIGIRRLSIIFDLLILGLSGALIFTLARIPGWRKHLARGGIASQSDLIHHSGKTAFLHFTGPLALLSIARGLPGWITLVMFQPDLVNWLYAAASLVALEGLVKIGLIWGVFCQTRRNLARLR